MEYTCLLCGYNWDTVKTDNHLALGYRRCPACRSYDVAPASFPRMVEIARELGISHITPLQDIMIAFQAVWMKEGLLSLGFREFFRVMRRVINEVESQ